MFQVRPSFKRNKVAVSTDFKAISQNACQLNLTWF